MSLMQNIMRLLFQRGARGPINYSINKQALSFSGQRWTFDIGLAMQSKSRTFQTLTFYVLHSRFGFALQEAYP